MCNISLTNQYDLKGGYLMKKTLIILGLILILLTGCSQEQEGLDNSQEGNNNSQQEEEINLDPDVYGGNFGSYRLIKTQLKENHQYMQENQRRVNLIVEFTNTTYEAQRPGEAFTKELIVEHETEIELNAIGYVYLGITSDYERTEEEQEMVEISYLNIKPGATVTFLAQIHVEEEIMDSLYLRDRNEYGLNGDKYEVHLEITQ